MVEQENWTKRRDSTGRRGAIYGLAAAASFGVSAPLAKTLLADTHPVLLAGILYLGAAVALTVAGALCRTKRAASEAPLQRGDVPALVGVSITGGVVGPILMLYGLQHVSGLTGALWLNLEAPLTMLVAVALFAEHLDRREIAPAALILLGALALGLEGGTLGGNAVGALALSGACLSWALDNNLTQRLSIRDPIAIVRDDELDAHGTVGGAGRAPRGAAGGGERPDRHRRRRVGQYRSRPTPRRSHRRREAGAGHPAGDRVRSGAAVRRWLAAKAPADIRAFVAENVEALTIQRMQARTLPPLS